MTLLADSIGQSGYDMLISGFILGTVIFALFLWSAIQGYKNVKQIRKFKEKTDNYFEDKYALNVIRLIKILNVIFYVIELATFIAAIVLMSEFSDYERAHPAYSDDAHKIQINNPSDPYTSAAGATSITTDVMFLAVAILVISYMTVSALWMPSTIVVIDNDTLITTNAIAPKNAITVSRIIKAPHMFKISYKDQEIKGNLKEVKLRYSEKMNLFLSRNGFYQGEVND